MRRSLFWFAAIAVFIPNAVGRAQSKVHNYRSAEKVFPRILEGHKVTNPDYPYVVSVQIWGIHYCGGSIIGDRVVLTAAHCFEFENNARKYSIQYGVTHIGGTNNIIHASSLLKHPQFNPSNMDYDVGLIFLLKAIEFGCFAKRINLAVYKPKAGSPANVTGWGSVQEGGNFQNDLHAVTVHTLAQSTCLRMYKHFRITPRMMCASEPLDGKDACGGDSGGPLVAGGVQVGIVSFGIGCGHKEHPGIYTNVAAVRRWIQSNTYE